MPTRYQPALDLMTQLLADRLVTRIWQRDLAAWGAQAETPDARSIETRLGWLDIPETMPPHLDRLAALGQAARDAGIAQVLLLGMGGSSLCAEVISTVFGVAEGSPSLVVLDTTDEQTLTTAAGRLDPRTAWFIVASKSGTTVEVASMERYFWSIVEPSLGPATGQHFIAVTDPGTALQSLAERKGYREVFINPPDIGGRFSALSLFGLVPTALIGASAADLLEAGSIMAQGCQQEAPENAGLELGSFIGAATRAGRNKLTVALAPSLSSLGLWIEQLIAESTGKHGTGALPVVDEPLGRPDEYGQDRAFVAIASDRDSVDADRLRALEDAGHPVLRLSMRIDGLGAEFFRWEFATAVAGAVLGINPFDEPNVAEAKDKTKALLTSFAANGQLPAPPPTAAADGVDAFSTRFKGNTPAAVVAAALATLTAGDYVAFLSYLPASNDVTEAIADVRRGIRARYHVASTFGVGPRYLHSTGQYHKGGPDGALAFVLTAGDDTETAIPEAGYSFSVLKRAQALGDTQTLEAHQRRTVRLHLPRAEGAARAIEAVFAAAMK